MLSVAAASRAGRRVTKAPRKPQDAPVKAVEFKRSEPSPAFPELPNDTIPIDIEDVEDPSESLDGFEQCGIFAWDDEESEALRQGRGEAELTLSADSVRAYLK